jgi:hypothetical protein
MSFIMILKVVPLETPERVRHAIGLTVDDNNSNNNSGSSTTVTVFKPPAIQQFLADEDPDVDAM